MSHLQRRQTLTLSFGFCMVSPSPGVVVLLLCISNIYISLFVHVAFSILQWEEPAVSGELWPAEKCLLDLLRQHKGQPGSDWVA